MPICERETCAACGSVISTPVCPKCGLDNTPVAWPADESGKVIKEVGP